MWRSGWGGLVVLLEEREVSIREVRRQIGIGPLRKVYYCLEIRLKRTETTRLLGRQNSQILDFSSDGREMKRVKVSQDDMVIILEVVAMAMEVMK